MLSTKGFSEKITIENSWPWTFFCIQSCELSTTAKNQIKEEDEMSIDNLLNDIPV